MGVLTMVELVRQNVSTSVARVLGSTVHGTPLVLKGDLFVVLRDRAGA